MGQPIEKLVMEGGVGARGPWGPVGPVAPLSSSSGFSCRKSTRRLRISACIDSSGIAMCRKSGELGGTCSSTRAVGSSCLMNRGVNRSQREHVIEQPKLTSPCSQCNSISPQSTHPLLSSSPKARGPTDARAHAHATPTVVTAPRTSSNATRTNRRGHQTEDGFPGALTIAPLLASVRTPGTARRRAGRGGRRRKQNTFRASGAAPAVPFPAAAQATPTRRRRSRCRSESRARGCGRTGKSSRWASRRSTLWRRSLRREEGASSKADAVQLRLLCYARSIQPCPVSRNPL